MTRTRLGILAIGSILLVAVANLILDQYRANQQLEGENARLRTVVPLLESRQRESDRLRSARPDLSAVAALKKEQDDRLKDKAEVGRLRRKLADYRQTNDRDVQAIRQEIEEAKARRALGQDVTDPNSFKETPLIGNISLRGALNRGSATPETTLETWLWAVQHKEVEDLMQLRLTPNLPMEIRKQFRQEALLAMDGNTFTDVTDVVLKTKSTKGNDEVFLGFELKRNREPAPRESNEIRLHLKRFENEWKINSVTGMSSAEK